MSRPRTIPRRLRIVHEERYPKGVVRPRFRSECEKGPRPCPFVSCRHHLLLDIHPETGSIKLNFPEGPEVMKDTCALDVADRGDATLEDVGERLNVTRERARQIEAKALLHMGNDPSIRELVDEDEPLPPLLEAVRELQKNGAVELDEDEDTKPANGAGDMPDWDWALG